MDDDLRNMPIHVGMFVSALGHALGNEDMRAAYQAQTGKTPYQVPTNALEAMVDQATGADRAAIEDFARWFAKEIWGPDEAPDMEVVFAGAGKADPAG